MPEYNKNIRRSAILNWIIVGDILNSIDPTSQIPNLKVPSMYKVCPSEWPQNTLRSA